MLKCTKVSSQETGKIARSAERTQTALSVSLEQLKIAAEEMRALFTETYGKP
jgi:hypothetical protein